jgi:hypothetical protein
MWQWRHVKKLSTISHLTKNGCPDWNLLTPFLRGLRDQDELAVTTCQQTFNNCLARNSRPTSGTVDPHLQRSPQRIESTQETAGQ